MGASQFLDSARRGDTEALRHLLSEGADPNSCDIFSGYSALYNACSAGHVDAALVLLRAGADVTERGNTVRASPLAAAAINGHADVVRMLLAECDDLRSLVEEERLVDEATEEGFEDVANVLREYLASGD